LPTMDYCVSYLEYLPVLSLIVGTFEHNAFNKSIPNNAIIAKFNKIEHIEIRLSDELKKFAQLYTGIEYFEIDEKLYSRDSLFKEFGSKFNTRTKMPDIVYHGTSSEYIDSILTHGLVPNPSNSQFKVYHDRYIFLTTSYVTAQRYAKGSIGNNYKADPIVLEIRSDRLDINKVQFDYDYYKTKDLKNNDYYDGMISSKLKEEDTDISNKNMGGAFVKFGYDGIVYPDKISKIYYQADLVSDKWAEYSIAEFKEFWNVNWNAKNSKKQIAEIINECIEEVNKKL